MALNDLKNWKGNFPDRNHVQPDEHGRSEKGAFLSGESAVVVAGPPTFDDVSSVETLIPIGLVQQAQINQNKQLNQVYEIGGRLPFYIPARVTVNASLSRVIFDGPSLFYALYRANDSNSESTTVPSYSDFFAGESVKAGNSPTMPYPADGNIVQDPAGQAQNNPGLFWTNLASSIFNKPLGLGFILYDMEGEPYGGVYLESCYVRSHNFGISANQTVLAENVSLAATKLRPLSAASLPGPAPGEGVASNG